MTAGWWQTRSQHAKQIWLKDMCQEAVELGKYQIHSIVPGKDWCGIQHRPGHWCLGEVYFKNHVSAKKLCICLARQRRKVSDCGVSNTKRRHAGRWDLLLSTKGTALPRKWTDKNLVRKSRKILLTISEILQHLSNRIKHASEKCNERVGNDCPVLRIPVGSNPMASSSWTSRARELQHRHTSLGHIPSQAAQGLSTQHRLGQADGVDRRKESSGLGGGDPEITQRAHHRGQLPQAESQSKVLAGSSLQLRAGSPRMWSNTCLN